jgi:hypothetical protein
VKGAYIQRSVVPPQFVNPAKFLRWFHKQQVRLVERNNPVTSADSVFIVQLRRPDRASPNESRDDPFWESGSFGITGCHSHNLMNCKRANQLTGARLAFSQGGRCGTRLVYLTPPVKIVPHGELLEARWTPREMPFRYEDAPVLIANKYDSDFPALARSV